jgi:hypothetical protein
MTPGLALRPSREYYMMMGKRTTIRLETRQIRAAERMEESGDADSQSEALRQLVNAGMEELGYGNGETPHTTTLQRLTRESARALIYVGVGWLLLGWMFPVSYRAPAAAVVVAGAGLLAFERVLEEYEPGVSRRLFGWYGGGERA